MTVSPTAAITPYREPPDAVGVCRGVVPQLLRVRFSSAEPLPSQPLPARTASLQAVEAWKIFKIGRGQLCWAYALPWVIWGGGGWAPPRRIRQPQLAGRVQAQLADGVVSDEKEAAAGELSVEELAALEEEEEEEDDGDRRTEGEKITSEIDKLGMFWLQVRPLGPAESLPRRLHKALFFLTGACCELQCALYPLVAAWGVYSLLTYSQKVSAPGLAPTHRSAPLPLTKQLTVGRHDAGTDRGGGPG